MNDRGSQEKGKCLAKRVVSWLNFSMLLKKPPVYAGAPGLRSLRGTSAAARQTGQRCSLSSLNILRCCGLVGYKERKRGFGCAQAFLKSLSDRLTRIPKSIGKEKLKLLKRVDL